MSVRGRIRLAGIGLIWRVGERLPHDARERVCRTGALLLYRLPLPGIARWAENHRRVLGDSPTPAERRLLVESWLRNNLMSLSLATWRDDEVLARVRIRPDHLERLRESMAGPGLVMALPHMGSWDLAGAWAARVGFRVSSVAERLPSGLFERFRAARERMGMTIHAYGGDQTMALLEADVRAGRLVCLLADRDLSGRGVEVPWPTDDHPLVVRVPAGPALLARRTGADLRVAVAIFHGDGIEILVSERIEVTGARETMTDVVAAFAEGIERSPTSWLMLQSIADA